jgi:hypothetical protein
VRHSSESFFWYRDSCRYVCANAHSPGRSEGVKDQTNWSPEQFNKIFSTFKVLQQSPAYAEAVKKGEDLNSPDVVRGDSTASGTASRS